MIRKEVHENKKETSVRKHASETRLSMEQQWRTVGRDAKFTENARCIEALRRNVHWQTVKSVAKRFPQLHVVPAPTLVIYR